jgi:serine/threonine-protein kinase HipA
METASNALIYFKDNLPAYITKRFDVRANGSKYMQEDFAQLTNRTNDTHGESFKYDGNYEEIGQLIKRFVAASAPALERFFQLVVFNYVISNGDTHLKNFSLIRSDSGEYQLTPAYDLMSTAIHTPMESDTALNLYESDMDSTFYSAYGYYGRDNFMELSKRLGIIEKRAAMIIDQFPAKEKLIRAFVEQSFLSEAVKAKYISNVVERIRRIKVPLP